MKVAVLLSTYNGEEYLPEQLDSLLAQTYQELCICVRDDGSTDKTPEIIEKYKNKYPQKVTCFTDDVKKLGPARSFIKLLSEVQAEYYFFCDQDDYWKNDKVERTLSMFSYIEGNDKSKPVLVHTDAEIVDQNLQNIYPSLWKKMNVHPWRLDNKWMLPVCCTVTGCTMAINDAAKQISLPMPEDADMHDNWIAFRVSQNGIVKPLKYASMLYRQHSSNAVGILGTGQKVRREKIRSAHKTIAEYNKWATFYSNNGYGSKVKWFFFKLIFFVIR